MLAITINYILFFLFCFIFAGSQQLFLWPGDQRVRLLPVTASLKLVLAMNLWLIWQQPIVILGVLFWRLRLRLFPFLFQFVSSISLLPHVLLSVCLPTYLPTCSLLSLYLQLLLGAFLCWPLLIRAFYQS